MVCTLYTDKESFEMDWIGPVIAGLSGALAAVIAQLTVGFKKERRGLYLVVLVLLFVVLRFSAVSYVEPLVRVWDAERQVRKIPFYKELSVHDPVAYERIKEVIQEAARTGDSTEKIAARIADVLQDVFPRYIPKASDDSVLTYVNLMVVQLEELDRANPDACYAFMFPHKFGEPGLGVKYLDAKSKEKDLDVLKEIIESATTNPQAKPDRRKSEELLEPILTTLVQKYGADVSLLQGTARNSTERKKVCEISSEMFRQIASLPKQDASMLLRYLLSSKD